MTTDASARSNPSDSRILSGDALTILRTLPSGSIDSCITDPPFNLTRSKRHQKNRKLCI
jgi:DNA modification methylase